MKKNIIVFLLIAMFFGMLTCKKDTKKTSPTPTVKDADGNVYDIITIGTQVWMQYNLATTKYNDGTAIPFVTDNTIWNTLTSPAFCWYNDSIIPYKNLYGALYNWYAVNTGKLCPVGWHVPTAGEWDTLINYLGGINVAGGVMKSTKTGNIRGQWMPYSGMAGTNSSGFNALPSGIRYHLDGSFEGQGDWCDWWATTENNGTESFDFGLKCFSMSMFQGYDYDSDGFSVRCVKDN